MSQTRAESVRVAQPLFHEAGSGSTPTSALDLWFGKIEFKRAKEMNKLWHSRLPQLTSPQCRVAFVAEYDGLYYAVAIWSRPIARLLPQTEWLELQRMAIAPDAPKNTASRMLGWMARQIHREFPEITTLVSYQDMEVHTGCIYRASGWKPNSITKFSEWNRKVRARIISQSTADKQRWEKEL